MDKFLGMVEQSTDVCSTEEIDENLFKEFLSKGSVWDFHNISREEYSVKSNSEKELLTLKLYNEMSKGKGYHFLVCSFIACVFTVHNLFISRVDFTLTIKICINQCWSNKRCNSFLTFFVLTEFLTSSGSSEKGCSVGIQQRPFFEINGKLSSR